MKQTLAKHKTAILVVVLILCAVLARLLGKFGVYPMPLGLTHTVICIGISVGWGLSVNFRILQKSVRRYIVGVAIMEVFWFFVRSLKYYFVSEPNVNRYLWYLYYIPLLCIPFFAVLASEQMGKPENYRLPKWTWVLSLALTVLCVVVLSNDLHQLVFSFPEGEAWTDMDYQYGTAFYFVLGFQTLCAVVTFIILLRKSRYANSYKHLPVVLVFLCSVFSVFYVTGLGYALMDLLFGDVVMMLSLMFMAVFESTMKCGLIQTNTGYQYLFRAGALGAVIVDKGDRVRYASANAPWLTREMIEEAKHNVAELDKNTVLKSNPIHGGYVYWKEDVTAMNALLERLRETGEAIAESNLLEEENYRTKQRINAIREKNRLYDLLQEKTAPQVALLNSLFTRYAHQQDTEKQRALLAKIAVVGAYIKRCGNLLFIGEKGELTTTSELSLCVEESLANLRLMAVDCEADITKGVCIYAADAIRVYDFFERAIETALDSLSSVWLKARVTTREIIFRLEVESEANLGELHENSGFEEGVWGFTLRIERAVKQDE